MTSLRGTSDGPVFCDHFIEYEADPWAGTYCKLRRDHDGPHSALYPDERSTEALLMAQTGERLVRTNPYVPEATPAEPDDERVVFLLGAYPEYDACRWVQSMVGWRRKAAEYEAERDQLREALQLIASPNRATYEREGDAVKIAREALDLHRPLDIA